MSTVINTYITDTFFVVADSNPATSVFRTLSGVYVSNGAAVYSSWLTAGHIEYATPINGVADNGSGAVRLTIDASLLTTSQKWAVADLASGYDGNWTITKTDSLHVDLIGSTYNSATITSTVGRLQGAAIFATHAAAMDTLNKYAGKVYTTSSILVTASGTYQITNPPPSVIDFTPTGAADILLPQANMPTTYPIGFEFEIRVSAGTGTVTLKDFGGTQIGLLTRQFQGYRITMRGNTTSVGTYSYRRLETIATSGSPSDLQYAGVVATPKFSTRISGVATGFGEETTGTDVLSALGLTTSNNPFMTGAVTITSTSSNALTVGRTGSTNPAFRVDDSTSSQVNGIKLVGSATGGLVLLSTDGSDTNIAWGYSTKGSASHNFYTRAFANLTLQINDVTAGARFARLQAGTATSNPILDASGGSIQIPDLAMTGTPTAPAPTTTSNPLQVATVGFVENDAPTVVRAWAIFPGATGVPTNSFGTASVVRTATGNYLATLTVPFSNSAYGVMVSAESSSIVIAQLLDTKTASTFQVVTTITGTAADVTRVSFFVVGRS